MIGAKEDTAGNEGPQRVVEQADEAAMLVPAQDFERGPACGRQRASVVDCFRSAPTGDKPLDLRRKRDVTRTIKW